MEDPNYLTVGQLVAFLQTQPQDLLVIYRFMSDWSLLEAKDIKIRDLCQSRLDGYVHDVRPDKPTQPYLAFPGN